MPIAYYPIGHPSPCSCRERLGTVLSAHSRRFSMAGNRNQTLFLRQRTGFGRRILEKRATGSCWKGYGHSLETAIFLLKSLIIKTANKDLAGISIRIASFQSITITTPSKAYGPSSIQQAGFYAQPGSTTASKTVSTKDTTNTEKPILSAFSIME